MEPKKERSKKRKEDKMEIVESSSSEDDSSDDDLGQDQIAPGDETIDVEFEAFGPQENDFHAIKTLLKSYLEETPYNSSQLADVVVSEGVEHGVGSVIKADGNEQAFGFISAINLHHHKDKECVRQVRQYVLSHLAGQPALRQQLETLFDDETRGGFGLLLNERLVNVPVDVAPPLHQSLHQELKEAAKREGGGAKAPHRLTNCLLLTSTFKGVLEAKKKQAKKPKAKGASGEEQPADQLYYFKPEEEVFAKETALSHSWTVAAGEQANRWTFDGMKSHSRLLLVVPAAKLPSILKQIEALVVSGS